MPHRGKHVLIEVTDKAVREALGMQKRRSADFIPPPPEMPGAHKLSRSGLAFRADVWEAWVLMTKTLKRKLRNTSHDKRLPEGNGKVLFKLSWKNEEFKLHILQKWAIKKLGFSQEVYIFKTKDPSKIYFELIQIIGYRL